MTVTHTIGKGIAWNTVGSVVGKGVVFFNVFLVLRHLSVYEYGLSELVFSVVSTASIFLLPGLDAAITADLAVDRARKDYGRMKTLFWQYVSVSGGLSTLAWALIFFGASYSTTWFGSHSLTYYLPIASLLLLLSPLRGISQLLAAVEARFLDLSLYSVIEESVKSVCLLLFFLVIPLGITGLFLATLIAQALTICLYVPRTLSAYRTFASASAHPDFIFWEILRAHRKWSVAVTYLNTLSKTLQLWLVRFFGGTVAVGLYAFAMGILGQIVSFLPFGTILTSLLPQYIDKANEQLQLLRSSIKAQLLLSIALLSIAVVCAPFLFLLFPQYLPARTLVYVTLLAVVPAAVVGVYTPWFMTLKEQRTFFTSMLWKTLFLVLAIGGGSAMGGVVGIGVGVALGFLASMVERTLRLKRLIPDFSFPNPFSWDSAERQFFVRGMTGVRSLFSRFFV